jgi:hypothetical protein
MAQSPYISNRNKERYQSGIYIAGPTLGLSSPGKGSRVGCLCKNKPVYSRQCCDKTLIAQGIGLTQKPASE